MVFYKVSQSVSYKMKIKEKMNIFLEIMYMENMSFYT